MKKMNLASTLALAMGLTLASATLAHAGDNMSGSSDTSTSNTSQSPGTMGTETKNQTTSQMTESWKTAKSCTDEAGNTYKKGQKGFKSCIEAMRKKEQMGGTPPSNMSSGSQSGSESSSQ